MTERRPEPIGINDVGGLFTTTGKDAWRLIGVTSQYGIPKLQMEKWDDTSEIKESIPSDFQKYLRLVPEIAPKRKYERKATPPSSPDESRTGSQG